ncbi:MAG: hypothetical protein HC915_07305 [Anaerolineae bacterium]|nr:hypothetical protein [Anaerolineae bacterium]
MYQTIAQAYSGTPAYLLEMNLPHLTLFIPLEEQQQARQVRDNLAATQAALAAVQRWIAAHGSILKGSFSIMGAATAGSLRLQNLEQHNAWRTFLFASSAIAPLEQALALAEAGQLLVLRDLLKLLGFTPQGEWRTDQVFLSQQPYADLLTEDSPRSSLMSTHLPLEAAAFENVHNRYLERFARSKLGRREPTPQPLSCLCLRLHVLSLENGDQELAARHTILRTIHELAERFGGFVDFRQLDVSQAAHVFLFFGVLGLYDDYPQRALSCAQALVEALRPLDPHLRLGVDTGIGLATFTGPQVTQHYLIISPTLEGAIACAEQAAPREIVATASTQQASGPAFVWSDQGERGFRLDAEHLPLNTRLHSRYPFQPGRAGRSLLNT